MDSPEAGNGAEIAGFVELREELLDIALESDHLSGEEIDTRGDAPSFVGEALGTDWARHGHWRLRNSSPGR